MSKKDLSIPGALLVVASQLVSSYSSTDNISKQIKRFRQEFKESIQERDEFFVRKTELTKLSQKIDSLTQTVNDLSKQLKKEYSKNDRDLIGCSYRRYF